VMCGKLSVERTTLSYVIQPVFLAQRTWGRVEAGAYQHASLQTFLHEAHRALGVL
jgi:hypothetical protein